ncbi:hypothetical protein SmJEL517_g03391 [Synchytrium microbalum]|uniref:Uncharacterized protein n=1 Tax=Synchytrium microbalum TaxID=1806994 RepID=A0A507C717_9FUNG|nr:uncharacterized protein SmJEL517_g03391 [Synchytrium microbalum]TPX33854.1 hypothetical protein SmJEL517_g03391 [Synchytrium microbalum]
MFRPPLSTNALGKRPATTAVVHPNAKRTAIENHQMFNNGVGASRAPNAKRDEFDDEFGAIDKDDLEVFETIMSQHDPAYPNPNAAAVVPNAAPPHRPPPQPQRQQVPTVTASVSQVQVVTATGSNSNRAMGLTRQTFTHMHSSNLSNNDNNNNNYQNSQQYHHNLNQHQPVQQQRQLQQPYLQNNNNLNHHQPAQQQQQPQQYVLNSNLNHLQPVQQQQQPQQHVQNNHNNQWQQTKKPSEPGGLAGGVGTTENEAFEDDVLAMAHRAQDVNLLTRQMDEYKAEITKLRQQNAELNNKNRQLDLEILTKIGEASMVRGNLTRFEQDNKNLRDQLRDHQVKSIKEHDAMKKDLEKQEHEIQAREYQKSTATFKSPRKAEPQDGGFPTMASFTFSPKKARMERPVTASIATMTDVTPVTEQGGRTENPLLEPVTSSSITVPIPTWNRSAMIHVSFEHENILFLRQLLTGPTDNEDGGLFREGILQRMSLSNTIDVEFSKTYSSRASKLLNDIGRLANDMTLSLTILLSSLDWILRELLQHKLYTPLSCLSFMTRVVVLVSQDCRNSIAQLSCGILDSLLQIWNLISPVALGGSEATDMDYEFLGANTLDCLKVLSYEPSPQVLASIREQISPKTVQMCLDVKQPGPILIRTIELCTLLAEDRETFDVMFQDTVYGASARRRSVLDRVCALLAFSPQELDIDEVESCLLYGAIIHQLSLVSLRYSHIPLRIVGYHQNLSRLASFFSSQLDQVLCIVSFADISLLPPTTPARLHLIKTTVNLLFILLGTRRNLNDIPVDTYQVLVSSMAKLFSGGPDIPMFEDIVDYAKDILDFVLSNHAPAGLVTSVE